MSCPDCAHAATHPDAGIANVRCIDCCVRVLELMRRYGKHAKKAQDTRLEAWEQMPGYVGTELVLNAIKGRAQLRAMAPIREGA